MTLTFILKLASFRLCCHRGHSCFINTHFYFIFVILLKNFVYIVYFAHVCFLTFIMLVLCGSFRVSMHYLNLQGAAVAKLVKLLACRARGPGFNSRPRHLNFQRLVISCFQVEMWLKDCKINVNPQNNQPTLHLQEFMQAI